LEFSTQWYMFSAAFFSFFFHFLSCSFFLLNLDFFRLFPNSTRSETIGGAKGANELGKEVNSNFLFCFLDRKKIYVDYAKVSKIFSSGFFGRILGVVGIILCNMRYICNTNMYPLTLGFERSLNYLWGYLKKIKIEKFNNKSVLLKEIC